ncbi:MAG: hypothetical protein ACTSRP_07730 [Candidatus Helarchaeota archaeon]
MLDKIINDLIQYTKTINWNNYYAKWTRNHDNDQSLLVHAINQASVIKYLIENIIEPGIISEDEKIILIVASYLSDTGKELPRFQNAAIYGSNEADAYNHINIEAIEQVDSRLEFFKSKFQKEYGLYKSDKEWEEFKKQVKAYVCYHQRVKAIDLKDSCSRFGGIPPFGPLIDYVDDLCSIKTVDGAYKIAIKKDGVSHLLGNADFVYHKISKIRGILTVFLNEALISVHEKFGYKPLLFYPDGILYIAKEPQKIEANLNELLEIIKNKSDKILNDPNIQQNLPGIIFGPVTKTVVLYPNLLNKQAIRTRIKDELNKSKNRVRKNYEKFMNQFKKNKIRKNENERFKGKSYLDYISERIKNYNINIELFIENYSKYQSVMIYVFSIMYILLDWVKDNEQLRQKIIERLNYYFPRIDLTTIRQGYANTASKINKFEMLFKLWELEDNTLIIAKTPEEIQDFEEKLIKFLEDIFDLVEQYKQPLITTNMLNDLLLDIEYTSIGNLKDNYQQLAIELRDAYLAGKSNKTSRSCFLCGLKYFQDAINERIGDGPRKFANRLIGGKRVGDGHQAGVCMLCECEATLRKVIMGSLAQELILITPELNMSWELRRIWAKEIDEFIKTQWRGISLLSDKNLYKVIRELAHAGNNIVKNLDARWIASNSIIAKEKRKKIIKLLKKEYDKIEEFNKSFRTNFQNFEVLVDAIYKGEWWDEDMSTFIEPASQIQYFYETPNYLIILSRYEFKDKDEPESAGYIKRLFFGILLSIIFNARIKFVKTLNPILNQQIRNIVEIPKTALFDSIVKCIMYDRKIMLHNRYSILKRVSSLMALQSMISNPENDFLLNYMKYSRGFILNKLLQREERINRTELLSILENFPSFEIKV